MFNLFMNMHPLTENGNKYQRQVTKSLLSDWLKLLSALSFYQDGAKILSKIPGNMM